MQLKIHPEWFLCSTVFILPPSYKASLSSKSNMPKRNCSFCLVDMVCDIMRPWYKYHGCCTSTGCICRGWVRWYRILFHEKFWQNRMLWSFIFMSFHWMHHKNSKDFPRDFRSETWKLPSGRMKSKVPQAHGLCCDPCLLWSYSPLRNLRGWHRRSHLTNHLFH